MKSQVPPVVILGCGYVGTRLAQSLLADGVQVRVCGRRVALLEPLRALGAEVHYLDAARPNKFGPALLGLDRPVVVYSIPGVPDLPQGEAVRRAASAAQKAQARAFVYLGSSAVYGRSEVSTNADWVDEDSAVATNDPEAGLRLADEAVLQAAAQGGLRTVILRLAAIYGPAVSPSQPARGVRQRLRSGQYKLWDGGRYYFSRIHVDDLVRVIRRAAERAERSATTCSTYVVGDDHPCPQLEYATWLCQHLGLTLPPAASSHLFSGPSHAIRGRRLRNARLKQDLGISLLYPTFREGELQIDECEKSGTLPPRALSEAPAQSAAPSPAARSQEAVAPPKLVIFAIEPGQDFAAQLGPGGLGGASGAALGLSLVVLEPGQAAAVGPHYFVLSGRLLCQKDDATAEAGPRSLVPAGVSLRNTGHVSAELLAIRAPTP